MAHTLPLTDLQFADNLLQQYQPWSWWLKTQKTDEKQKKQGFLQFQVNSVRILYLHKLLMIFISKVRKYVEGMKDATQLLDLLAAEGSNEIEPTKTVAGRQALYPEVRSLAVRSSMVL